MKPDLLISDLRMNALDGVDTAVRIRALMPECRVILHSGHVDVSDRPLRDRLEEHSLEVLPKPLHPETLLKRIHALCAEWTEPTVLPDEMARGALSARDDILGTLAKNASTPEAVRGIRNLLFRRRVLGSIEPDCFQTIFQAIPEGIALATAPRGETCDVFWTAEAVIT